MAGVSQQDAEQFLHKVAAVVAVDSGKDAFHAGEVVAVSSTSLTLENTHTRRRVLLSLESIKKIKERLPEGRF